jgi:site-specific recombinase XerD
MNNLKWLPEKDEKKILATVRKVSTFKARRDFTICILGFMTGMRLSEIYGLNVGDVKETDRLYVRPETAKRKKGRLVPLNDKARAAVTSWLKMKEEKGERLEDSAPLFISRKFKRLSRRSLQEMFEFWCKASGLSNRRYTVHSMRHSFAKRLVQNGVHLSVIQKLLGHASLASTGVYIEPGYEEMEEAVKGRR